MKNIENENAKSPVTIYTVNNGQFKEEQKMLEYLALNFDPFQKHDDPLITQYLEELQLTPYLDDPYKLTNIILERLHNENEDTPKILH